MNKILSVLLLISALILSTSTVVYADIPIEINPSDLSCKPLPYECRNPDSPKYTVSCSEVLKEYEGEIDTCYDGMGVPYDCPVCKGPYFPCRTCFRGKSYYYPERPEGGHGETCPIGSIPGQTDALGQGLYQTYDFDRPSLGNGSGLVQVPPLHLEAPGTYSSAPIVDIPDLPDLPEDNAPCGWPVNGRAVTGVCPAGYDPQYPSNASSVDVSYAHGYPAIDVAVREVPVASTMAGTAYRCAGRLDQAANSNNPGIYVRVVDNVNGYATQYLHLQYEAGDVSPYENPNCSTSSACAYGGCLVSATNVARGDSVGTSSNTGDSRPQGSGYHLHYEVWYSGARVCPATFMDYTAEPCTAVAPANFVQRFLDAINPF